MSALLGDCFSLFFRDNFLEEICKWSNKEGQGVFSNNWKDTTVAELSDRNLIASWCIQVKQQRSFSAVAYGTWKTNFS